MPARKKAPETVVPDTETEEMRYGSTGLATHTKPASSGSGVTTHTGSATHSKPAAASPGAV